jgi:hypothetical protein
VTPFLLSRLANLNRDTVQRRVIRNMAAASTAGRFRAVARDTVEVGEPAGPGAPGDGAAVRRIGIGRRRVREVELEIVAVRGASREDKRASESGASIGSRSSVEFRNSKLFDEVVTPHAKYGVAGQVISTGGPDRANTSQKRGPRPPMCTQQERHLEAVEVKRAVSEDGATRCRNRLHVHHTARKNAGAFEIGRRGRMVACPIVEAAEESPGR